MKKTAGINLCAVIKKKRAKCQVTLARSKFYDFCDFLRDRHNK